MTIDRIKVGARLVGSVGILAMAGSAWAGPGEILVGNQAGRNVLKFDASQGTFLKKFLQMGQAEVTDLTWGPDGDLYLTDVVHAAVLRYDGKTGAYKGQFVTPGLGDLGSPQSLVFGPNGNLYVTGTPNYTINEYDGKTGAFVKHVFLHGSTVPGQITFGPHDGMIYYICQTCDHLVEVDPETGMTVKILVEHDENGPGVARGVVWGPNGNVFLTSGGENDTIREYDGLSGALVGTFASGGMDEPYDVIFGAEGVMYVACAASSNVVVFDGQTGAFLCQGAPAGEGGLAGGAMGVVEMPGEPCYADFTGDDNLDIFDFLGYMNSFNAGESRADCDEDNDRDLFDFLCYMNAFSAGC